MLETPPWFTLAKRCVFEGILDLGGILKVAVDTSHPDVTVPERFKAGQVVLRIGAGLVPPTIPDIDDQGVSVELLFGVQLFLVSFPWDAVFAIVSESPEGIGLGLPLAEPPAPPPPTRPKLGLVP